MKRVKNRKLREKNGKVELHCLLENDDIKVSKKLASICRGRRLLWKRKLPRNQGKITVRKQKNGQEFCLTIEIDLNSETLASLGGWETLNSSLIKNHLRHEPTEDKD